MKETAGCGKITTGIRREKTLKKSIKGAKGEATPQLFELTKVLKRRRRGAELGASGRSGSCR